jgi:hypothetical protein
VEKGLKKREEFVREKILFYIATKSVVGQPCEISYPVLSLWYNSKKKKIFSSMSLQDSLYLLFLEISQQFMILRSFSHSILISIG